MYRLLLLLFVTFNIYSNDLFFETATTSSTNFGGIDVVTNEDDNLRSNIISNSAFDKSEGWEIVAVDDTKFYYQITDASSLNFGKIDYWDSSTEIRSNYGFLSDIFSDPTNWTLGGADDGILYFNSSATNSEIVSWNGITTTHFAYLRDIVAVPQYWKLVGFDNGYMYIEWTHSSNAGTSIKTWNGTSAGPTYDNTNYYENYSDAYLFGVTDYPISTVTSVLSSIDKIKNHILGTSILTASELNTEQTILNTDIIYASTNASVIKACLDLIHLYDSTYGALFTPDTTTYGGYSRTASGFELENLMLSLMQNSLNNFYTKDNLTNHSEIFEDVKFDTSSYFPGAVDIPADKTISYVVKINGKHVEISGTPPNYETEDARRPTGCYLAPGSVAKITVPNSLVGVGASVLVGAHTWDLSSKPLIKRMDIVYTKYEITSTTTTIANPLGGGIYINIPFQKDFGIIDVTLENVVQSPYYANTVANKTSLSDWLDVQRKFTAPWADFETEKVMMQVPTSWIYDLSDPVTLMDDWDLSMDGISEMLDRPYVRSKTIVYSQVDVIMRGDANYPGYPQSNVTYNPYSTYDGNHDNYLITGPRNERGYQITTFFHELGHAEKIYKYRGEVEAFVNFLWVAAYNKKFDVELNQAFVDSRYYNYHTIDEAAISWMIAENFRLGNNMRYQDTSGYRDEFGYQYRGHGKYADIVRLFGWEPIEGLYKGINDSYNIGEYESVSYNVNQVPADGHTLRLCKSSGYDMRPLIHFWGIIPDDFNSLETSVEALNVKKSTAIYDQLMYYKTIIPMDNADFRAFGLSDYSQNTILNFVSPYTHKVSSYYEGFLKEWWDDYDNSEGLAAYNELERIIDLYFPEGRPEETNSTCYPIKPIAVEASSYEAGSTNSPDKTLDEDSTTRWAAKGEGESIVYDFGRIIDFCNIDIEFYNGISRYNYFDIEVSRDGKTYAKVFQNKSNSKLTDSFDPFSLSRSARYVKIIGRGNETSTWNSIEEVKFYSTEKTLSNSEIVSTISNKVKIYPIPSNDTIHIDDMPLGVNKITIYNLEGKTIEVINSDKMNIDIDVSAYQNGIYLLKIDSNSNSYIQKIIISD
jgi:hypothetical protein